MILGTIALALVIVGIVCIVKSCRSEHPPIPGLPEPRGIPVLGNLFGLGPSPALTYLKWSRNLKSSVIQVRLGTKRLVILNSFDAAVELIFHNMAANCDRPQQHTFSNVVSTTGLTVGTTPYGASYKRMRRAIGSHLCSSGVNSRVCHIDRESHYTLLKLPTGKNVRPHLWFKAYAFNVSMSTAYGYRMNDLDAINEILNVEQTITKFRAHFATSISDYLPLLRWILPQSPLATECRRKREKYILASINIAPEKQDPSCLVAAVKRGEYKLATFKELKSICMTLSSAGLDSIPGVLALFVGHMSAPYGQLIQERAYADILESFPVDPYNSAIYGKQIPYVSALVTELLRFSGMPLSLPRRTIQPIEYMSETGEKILIPVDTTLVLNIFAANFDSLRYEAPFDFNPDRFMSPRAGPPHFSFGAGSRMCAGSELVKRELYVMVVRLILLYRVLPSTNVERSMPTSPVDIYQKQSALMFDLPDFEVQLEPR